MKVAPWVLSRLCVKQALSGVYRKWYSCERRSVLHTYEDCPKIADLTKNNENFCTVFIWTSIRKYLNISKQVKRLKSGGADYMISYTTLYIFISWVIPWKTDPLWIYERSRHGNLSKLHLKDDIILICLLKILSFRI